MLAQFLAATDLMAVTQLPTLDVSGAREAAVSPLQFATPVPHAVDTANDGAWSAQDDNTVRWSYSVRVPGAVSMSFHAIAAALPPGSYVIINGFRHDRSDVAAGQLWSRTVIGDTLRLEAVVPSAEHSKFRLQLSELYAGFRSFVPETPSAGAAATDEVCTQLNYSCETQRDVGNSVVRISVSGAFGCSATLLNNTAGNLDPLLLTAAHCYTATGAATAEVAAQSMVAYWQHQALCGQSLDGGGNTVSQSGAISLASVGDSWLVRLNQAPPASVSPYWAGFDATDALQTGDAFGIHHGGGQAKQFTEFGIPQKGTLNGVTPGAVSFQGTPSWEAPLLRGEQIGGASGSALFNASSRVLGPLYGGSSNCDSKAPGEAGSASSGFTRLAYSFDGTLAPDTAFKPYLDPGNTGLRVADGRYATAPPASGEDGGDSGGGDSGGGSSGGGLGLGTLSLLWVAKLRRVALKRLLSLSKN